MSHYAQQLVDKVDAARVRYIWRMTEQQYKDAREAKMPNGHYLWKLGDYGKRGTICGMDVFFDNVAEPEVVAVVPDHVDVCLNEEPEDNQ